MRFSAARVIQCLHSQEVEMTSPLRSICTALAAGAAIAVCVGAPRALAQGTGTIRGKVTDALTKRPVDGVQVYVAGTELGTLTNADGRYQFSVRAGDAQLRSRRVGYGTVSQKVTLTAAQIAGAECGQRQADNAAGG